MYKSTSELETCLYTGQLAVSQMCPLWRGSTVLQCLYCRYCYFKNHPNSNMGGGGGSFNFFRTQQGSLCTRCEDFVRLKHSECTDACTRSVYTVHMCHELTASQLCSPKLLHKLHLLCTGGECVGPSHLPQGVLGRDGQVKTGCLVLTDHGLVLGRQDF